MTYVLIFDCFGVFYPDPVFAYMRDPQTPPEKAKALHELDKQAAVGALSKAGFVEQAAALLGCTASEAEQRFFVGTERNQELVDFVQQVRRKYKVALLSNIDGDMMDDFFTADELKDLFDVVVLSGNVKVAKPDPAIFKLVLKKLGVSAAEAIFTDDSENHILGAQKLGMQSIQFRSNEQLKEALAALGVSVNAEPFS